MSKNPSWGQPPNAPTRSTSSPSPIYGFPPGWSIADLPTAYTAAIPTSITAASTTQTSVPIALGANGLVVLATFTDAVTTCTVTVTDSTTSTVLKTFTNVSNATNDGLYCTYNDTKVLLQGDSVTVTVSNFTGSGSVAISLAPNN
jgi:archaellum component FlaF (FlaF/FlaG flagellin family)